MTPEKIFGNKIINTGPVSSTNDFTIKSLQKQNYEEGTIFITNNQYAGKGLDKNSWESEPGKNLTFSILIHPDFLLAEEQFMLNKFTALGIYDFIKTTVSKEQVSIKWPNDIYINKSKISGILINNTMKGNSFEYSVIGIGVNINQTKFKRDIPNPISLKQITKTDYSLDKCLQELIFCMNIRYNQLIKKEYEYINKDYLNSLLRFGKYSKYISNHNKFEARIINVAESGKLILQKRSGEILKFDFKEVEYVL